MPAEVLAAVKEQQLSVYAVLQQAIPNIMRYLLKQIETLYLSCAHLSTFKEQYFPASKHNLFVNFVQLFLQQLS